MKLKSAEQKTRRWLLSRPRFWWTASAVLKIFPQISDVTLILTILQELGADVRTVNRPRWTWTAPHPQRKSAPRAGAENPRLLLSHRRASGPLRQRPGAPPGGCDFGGRPIDQHIKGFVAMGAEVDVRGGYIQARAKGGQAGGHPDFTWTWSPWAPP